MLFAPLTYMPDSNNTPQTRPADAPSGSAMHQPSNPQRGQTYSHRNRRIFVPDEYIAVGYIVGVHGLRGEVKVELYTDFPERFVAGTGLYLGDSLAELTIERARPHKGYMLIQFKGIPSREHADELRNRWLFVRAEDAAELEEGVYWVHDIVGLQAQTEEGQLLGQIKEVLFTGANEVYIIKTAPTVNRGRDLLLPAIADVIQQIDLEKGIITVHLQPGLLEE